MVILGRELPLTTISKHKENLIDVSCRSYVTTSENNNKNENIKSKYLGHHLIRSTYMVMLYDYSPTINFNISLNETPWWLSWLSISILMLAQVMIPGHGIASCIGLCTEHEACLRFSISLSYSLSLCLPLPPSLPLSAPFPCLCALSLKNDNNK